LVLMSLLRIRGTRESAWLNAVVVAVKGCIVLPVVGIGWASMNPANHQPMIPARVSEVVNGQATGAPPGMAGRRTRQRRNTEP
jgi:APA family basic amino acid/polyamine antiporter